MPAPVPLPDLRFPRWALAQALLPLALSPSVLWLGGIDAAWAQSSQDLEQIQEQIDQGKIEATELKQKADALGKDVARLQRELTRSAADVQDAESEPTDL